MKVNPSFFCTFCAVLYCIFHTTSATKKVLLEFDQAHPKKWTWKGYYQPERKEMQNGWSSMDKYNTPKHTSNWRDQVLGTTMSKAVTNKYFHQKLVDVMPVLRDLKGGQISPHVYVKPGHDFKFEKVTHMLGGDKMSLLSIAYDLAHTVKSSKSNNGLELNMNLERLKPDSRRTVQLTPEELKEEEKTIGVEEQVIDPKTINEELMRDYHFVSMKTTGNRRNKRSAAKLVHKLIRIPPLNSTEGPLSNGHVPFDMKLNTSIFAGPYYKPKAEDLMNSTTLSYEQIEDLAFADLNGTEIELNGNDTDDEHLPSPEELVSGPRYRNSNKHRISFAKGDLKRKRIPIRSHQVPVLQKKCERFTASMCIKAEDYPIEQIMGSIRRHKNAMSALLAEYHDKAAELEYQEQLEEYQFNNKRREDGNVITPGGMCASVVRYARPQKARSAAGEWKYIVNTGRHTQTLRLEKCSTPQESCSYLSHNYRSRCTQVYNYHRLLSWDKSRGLHVDIFKVPTCCSCQVDGYRETFPPLGGSKHKEYKDYTPVPNNNPYASINDEIDYEDEDDDDTPIAYQFGSSLKRNKHENYQNSELLLGSTNIKTKVNLPRLNPTVGSYLSPPSDSYDAQVLSKNVRPTYYTHTNNLPRSRKPYTNFIPNESRADLEISGTEQSAKEIKSYAIPDNNRIHQKRTRVFSGSSNVETPYQTPSDTKPIYIPTTELTTTLSHAVSSTIGSHTRKETSSGKRINYNYHPIIDFFETHQKSAKGQLSTRNTPLNSIPLSSETITSRDRRIGYGIGGVENSWHPVVVNS